VHGLRAGAVMYPARLGGRNAKRLTVRSVTPADLSQTMGNTTQQMTAQPQDPNEVVDILVELGDEPAAAVLASQSLTPGTAAAEKTAAKVQQTLLRRQATVQSRLDRSLRQEQVDYTYSYTMLFNGFALRTTRKNLETIQSAKGVSRAFVAGSYTLPTVEQADTQALQVALATNQFTGKGMTIAVLDTGLDTAHPAFANASADAKFTKDYVSGILQAADLNAEALMPGVTADDVYLSAKIPFAFDYAGKDAQVAPGSKWDAANLEHGTHVAGISAGYAVDGEGAVTFSGVAPDAQVIPMKVFDDSGTGAATTTILAALEDACRLGVDAVNLSLGSYGGFTVDEDALINDVYNKLDDAGIMVITAAGNETSSSYMNSYGTDAPLTGDPDNSVVAAPSVYPANLSIATSSDVVLCTDADQYGDTKPVLDLGDDVAKNGSYDLTFHARNMGKDTAQYDVSVIAMSPAVLEQDGKTYMSSHDEALDVTVSGDKTVTLAAGATGDVKVSVSLSQSQKAKLDAAYENGIYVEGFVVLTAKDGSADLSIPFLAYYGDWSAPGMLDYATMLNEDTVPYSQFSTELGAYFTSSFAYHLGANLSVTMDGAEKTSLKAEHITISPNGDTYMGGVELVNVSQMRSASALHFTVTNADGQEVWSDAVTNVPKTIYVSSQGGPIPATMYQDMAPDAWYGTDNEGSALPDGQYYYTITADPVTDHESRNVRDTLTFPVYIDTQAPQLDQGRVTLSTGADGRTTLGMQVSDEHLYLDTEIFVANDDGTISTSSEKLLHKNVGLADMPDVTSDAMSVDVTDYAGKLLYVQLSDWGYNYAAYLVQLPDTFEGTTLSLSDTTAFLFTGEQQQLLAFDTDTEAALTWTSSNDDVASVDENGLVTAKAPGVTTVTATTANGASVSCVVGVSDQLTYTGLRLDFDEMTTTMYFDSTIDLPGVYLEPYGFALSGKHNAYGTDGLIWSVSDPTIADLDEYSRTTLVANKDGKSGDVTVTAEYQGMTASFTVHVGPYPGSVELYHGWIQARSNRIFLQGKQGIVGAGRDGIHATDTAATSDDQIITFTNSDPNAVDLTNPVIRATSNRDLPDECAFVDARNPGNAVITATATSTTQDTVQCFVTVVPKRYDGIQATQDTIHLKLGQGADLTQYLTLLDESGVVIPELNPVNYASLDESILSVDASGHVTALHTGTGMVRALLNTGDYTLIAVEVTCDHDHTTRTETPATCTEDGSVTVICDDCDEVLSTETLPATGHSTVVKNAKDATCTEPGYTGDKVCTVCGETGETGETGEVIPAAGHSYKDGKCTVCGAADPNANSGGNTGNNGTDSPNTADGAAMGLWLSLMTVAVLAGAVLVAGKTPRA
jgi:subtilisin family serine protease